VLWDFLTLASVYLFRGVSHDSINFDYPNLLHYWDYTREVGVPFWSFSQGMGQDIFPFSFGNIFRAVLLLLDRDQIAFGIAYVEFLKLLLAGWFFYLYLKSMGFSGFSGLIGSILYAFSSFMILGSTLGLFSTECVYFALLLYAFERLYGKGDGRLLPVVTALFAAFQPFALYLYGLFLVTYVFFRVGSEQGWQPRRLRQLLLQTAALSALGIGMAAVFAWGIVQAMVASPRLEYLDIFSNSLALGNLFAVKFPAINGELPAMFFSVNLTNLGGPESPLVYVGLLTLLLAPQMPVLVGRRMRSWSAALLCLWVLPLLFVNIRFLLWFGSGFYNRSVAFFFAFVLLLFAIAALDRLDKAKINLYLLLVTGVVAIALLFSLDLMVSTLQIPPALRWEIAGLLVLHTVLLAGYAQERGRGFVKAAILVLVIGEAMLCSWRTVHMKNTALAPQELTAGEFWDDDSLAAITYLKATDSTFFRLEKTYSSSPAPARRFPYTDAKAQGYYGTSSYTNFNHRYYSEFLQLTTGRKFSNWLRGPDDNQNLQAITATKYIISRAGEGGSVLRQSYDHVKDMGGVQIWRNPLTLSLGFAYNRFVPMRTFTQLPLEARPDFLLNSAVVLDDDFERWRGVEMSAEDSDVKEELRISSHRPGRIDGTVALAQPKLFFFSIPYDMGWRATDNGKEVALARVNIAFMGTLLSAGTHKLSLQYWPTYFPAGAVTSCLSLLVYIVFLVVFRNPPQPKRRVGRSD